MSMNPSIEPLYQLPAEEWIAAHGQAAFEALPSERLIEWAGSTYVTPREDDVTANITWKKTP